MIVFAHMSNMSSLFLYDLMRAKLDKSFLNSVLKYDTFSGYFICSLITSCYGHKKYLVEEKGEVYYSQRYEI